MFYNYVHIEEEKSFNIEKFINSLTVWEFDNNPRNIDIKISDDSMYNYINFYKNVR